jgi:hypothetical protein
MKKGDFKMFGSLFTFFKTDKIETAAPLGLDARRHHRFGNNGLAKIYINGLKLEMRDWSQGGFYANQNKEIIPLMIGDRVQAKLAFELDGEEVEIMQDAEVVRSSRRGFAVRFTSVTREKRRLFERVLDHFQTQHFIQSQVFA